MSQDSGSGILLQRPQLYCLLRGLLNVRGSVNSRWQFAEQKSALEPGQVWWAGPAAGLLEGSHRSPWRADEAVRGCLPLSDPEPVQTCPDSRELPCQQRTLQAHKASPIAAPCGPPISQELGIFHQQWFIKKRKLIYIRISLYQSDKRLHVTIQSCDHWFVF